MGPDHTLTQTGLHKWNAETWQSMEPTGFNSQGKANLNNVSQITYYINIFCLLLGQKVPVLIGLKDPCGFMAFRAQSWLSSQDSLWPSLFQPAMISH